MAVRTLHRKSLEQLARRALLLWGLWGAHALLSGCAGDPYARAQRSDTAAAYRSFLSENPEHEAASDARERLAELELAEARKVHTVLAYKRFLDEHGATAKAPEARALLAGLRFLAAQDAASAGALRQFLRDHPGSAHEDEARKLLADAEFRELGRVEDPQELARIAQAHAGDARAPLAEAQADDESYRRAEAKGPAALLDYLERFPAGAHRDEARVRLFAVELEGLAASGLHAEARQWLERSPLKAKLPDWPKRLDEEQALLRWARGDAELRQALAGYHLRPADELVRTLGAPDAQDRWEAADELGDHVSLRSLDPLLEELRRARSVRVRRVAFDAARRVLAALPPAVAEHQLTLRLRALRERAVDADVRIQQGALEELAGRPDAAIAAYAQAHDAASPDPFLLWRMAELRRAQGRWFSAGVAARQLALWAESLVAEQGPQGSQRVPLGAARQLCAGRTVAKDAVALLGEARAHTTELPGDLAAFERFAQDVLRKVEARLRDLELAVRTEQPGVRTCDDGAWQARRAEGAAVRRQALERLAKRPDVRGRALLQHVAQRDPLPEVRAAAARLLPSPGAASVQ